MHTVFSVSNYCVPYSKMRNFFLKPTSLCVLVVTIIVLISDRSFCQRPIVAEEYYTEEHLNQLKREVKELFYHAYNGYMTYAYPLDELQPLTCRGVDTWGSFSLTLIDSLDTLIVMGNYSEFNHVVEILSERKNFDSDINVSVFETNIRVVGGLISAHLLSHKATTNLEPGWPCNGPLLRLAEDAAMRLLPAFNSSTGMPYGTVNLRYGVPVDETPVTCTAGVGTFIVEFGMLSRLTKNPIYEQVAMKALMSLWNHRSNIGLVGNHINVETGQWIATDSGIGAAIDSYYEYLVKGSALLSEPKLMDMFWSYVEGINKYMRKEDWYFWVTMKKGAVSLPVFQNLEAYWPGVLSSVGLNSDGLKSVLNYHQVLKHIGFVPEMYDVQQGQVRANREGYPLRPELIESLMFLYRATADKSLLAIGEDILRAIQHSTKTPCGYATVKDTRDHRLEDRMESFFLAETTKYLYLLFDPDHFIHGRSAYSGKPHRVASRTCLLDTGAYIFNTEAHPMDAGAIDCCSGPTENDIWQTVWFPKHSEKVHSNKVRSDSSSERRSCMAPSWKQIFLDIDSLSCSFSQSHSTRFLKGQKSALNSLLTCKASPFMERLCIGGEVCDF